MAPTVIRRVPYTEEERQAIAQLCYQERLSHPADPWSTTLRKVRLMLPEERRFTESYTAPHQFSWLEHYLDLLNKNGDLKPLSNGKLHYSEEERQFIAKQYYLERQANPKSPSVDILKKVRALLPEDRKFGAQLHSIHQLSWLPSYLEALEQNAGQAPLLPEKAKKEKPGTKILDSRQKLQTEAPAPIEKKKDKKRKEKVFLDHDEKMIFAEQVYLLRKQFPGIEWQYVLKKANEALPEDRRVGKVPTSKAIKWLDKYIGMVEHQLAMKAAEPAPILQPIQTSVASPESSLVDNMAKMFGPLVMQAMMKAAQEAMGQAPVQTTQAEISQELKKKVLIVGLQPMQGQEIQREFGRYFNFKIFDSNVTADKIKANLPGHDYAILMTKFVSHPTQAAMRGHPGFTFCNGTVAALQERLSGWLQK